MIKTKKKKETTEAELNMWRCCAGRQQKQSWIFEDAEAGRGAMNQGMQALEVQKTQENVLPPEPPEETQCC